MPVTLTLSELRAALGRELGTSEWITISQETVNRFAETTGDHQWIHVDPHRAAAGPFGGTVAHGYLTLSLFGTLVPQVLHISDQIMGVNYGVDRIRFTSPVPVGSQIRLHARLLDALPRGEGHLLRLGVEVEVRDQDKPALVGEILFLSFGQAKSS